MKKDEALAEQHARQRVINRTEDDLRQLQGRLTRITAETEAARGRIQQIKAEVAEARAAIPNVNHLKQGKQSLLAKQALGQDVTGELQEIDGQMQESVLAADNARAKAQGSGELLTSLSSLVVENEKIIEQLAKNDLPKSWRNYLQALAEVAGEQYTLAAEGLLEKYARLVAIGSLLREHWEAGGRLQLPNMPVASAAEVHEMPHRLDFAAAVTALREDLQAKGLAV